MSRAANLYLPMFFPAQGLLNIGLGIFSYIENAMKLTAKEIRNLKLPEGKSEHFFWDDEIPGFGARRRAGGSLTAVFQYAIGGKQRRLSLGAVTEESFKTVRERSADGTERIIKIGIRDQAAQLHARVRLGEDPAAEKVENRRRAGETFGTVAQRFLQAKEPEMRPGSYDQIKRHINTYSKSLNELQAAKISRKDIATLLSTIKANNGPVAANRLRSTLSAFFSWAMSEGIDGVDTNPVTNTNKSQEKPRERVLQDFELRLIWSHAGDDHYGSIIRLLMLTGQRADEIANLRWSEVVDTTIPERRVTDTIKLPQFTTKAIELPATRTKNKRPHVVPLSKAAEAIINDQPVKATKDGELRDLIFGVRANGFSGWSRCKSRLDERIGAAHGEPLDHWTPHDLRRTMSTLMNDRLGVLPHVVEAILNHVSGSKGGVAGVYNKALYLRERAEALSLWAGHLASIVSGHDSNIFPMERAAS